MCNWSVVLESQIRRQLFRSSKFINVTQKQQVRKSLVSFCIRPECVWARDRTKNSSNNRSHEGKLCPTPIPHYPDRTTAYKSITDQLSIYHLPGTRCNRECSALQGGIPEAHGSKCS